jgi:hypothetical protein
MSPASGRGGVGSSGPWACASPGHVGRAAVASASPGHVGRAAVASLSSRPCCQAGESSESNGANMRGACACSTTPPLPAPSFCLDRGWKLY